MRYDADTEIYINSDNPKKTGTSAYNRYELYKKARTINEAKKMGATADDIRFDIGKGYIRPNNNPDFVSFNNILMELIKENKKLVKRVDELELYVKKNNKQNNYQDYLKEFKPVFNMSVWVNCFDTITEKQYEYLYDFSLLESMVTIFNEGLDHNNMVIRCFDKKPGVFYIYENEWKIDEGNDILYMIFKKIYKTVQNYFGNWEKDCFNDGSEKIMDLYLQVNLKIFNDIKQVFIKFKNEIYNTLKITIS
jgi:hypothetical protein